MFKNKKFVVLAAVLAVLFIAGVAIAVQSTLTQVDCGDNWATMVEGTHRVTIEVTNCDGLEGFEAGISDYGWFKTAMIYTIQASVKRTLGHS